MEYKEVLQEARKKFNGRCRVCRTCDGVACAGEIPGMGGIRTATSFKNNVKGWNNYGITMRAFGNEAPISTSCTLFGNELAMPIMVAPIGGIPLNMTEAMTEEEYCEAVCMGALEAGTIAFTGDSGAAGVFDAGLAQLEKTKGRMVPTIKPREDKDLLVYGQRALQMGATALACDVDAAVLVNMRLFGQPVEIKTMAQWKSNMEKLKVPFIIKGVMDKEAVVSFVEAGAKAIVISNHGGRILDGMYSTAELVEEIHAYAALKGIRKQFDLLVDGGIRTGEDVFKALALGADGVLVGRPAAIAAVGGGAVGVSTMLKQMQQSLRDAMYMNGVTSIDKINREMIKKIQN